MSATACWIFVACLAASVPAALADTIHRLEVVLEEDGRPAAGAQVWLLDRSAAVLPGDDLGFSAFRDRGRRFVADDAGIVILDDLPRWPDVRLWVRHGDRWESTTDPDLPARVVLRERPPLPVLVVDAQGAPASGAIVCLEAYEINVACVGQEQFYRTVWHAATDSDGRVDLPDPRWFHDHVDYGWHTWAFGESRWPESHLAVRVLIAGSDANRVVLDVDRLPESLTIQLPGDAVIATAAQMSLRPTVDEPAPADDAEADDSPERATEPDSVIVRGRLLLDAGVDIRRLVVSAYGQDTDLDATGGFVVRVSREEWRSVHLGLRRNGELNIGALPMRGDPTGDVVELGDIDMRGRLRILEIEVVDTAGGPIAGVECRADPNRTQCWIETDRFGRAYLIDDRAADDLLIRRGDAILRIRKPAARVRVVLAP